MKPRKLLQIIAVFFAAAGPLASLSHAIVYSITVDGTDAIFLAGRTDIVIPDPADPWTGPADAYLKRHGGATPEEAKETLPPFVAVNGGDVVKVADPAEGGINFFNGAAGGFFGPQGNGAGNSSIISALGGISGYRGTQGALVGVFLSNAIPVAGPPPTLDFAVLGLNLLTLSPDIGQVFFIGDGMTDGSILQEFVAPVGATRLFLGIPDAFGFNDVPGAYDDNDGSYRIQIGINEDPRNPPTSQVPDTGPSFMLLAAGLASFALMRARLK